MEKKLDTDIVSAQLQITKEVIGAWKSKILLALNNLGVFNSLLKGPLTIEELSQKLNLPLDSLERIVNAGVALKYLILKDGKYSNSKMVNTVVDPDKPGFMGNWLKLYSYWYNTFEKLENAIIENKAVENVNSNHNQDYINTFISGMTDYANYRGRDVLNYVDFSGQKTLLDVGCGPGIYISMFLDQFPNLHCTCLDVDEAIKIAKENLEKKYSGRVSYIVANYHKTEDFGGPYDVIFISHVLHQETKEDCNLIVKKAYNSLKPGGKVIIQAMFLNDDKKSPMYAPLHDLLTLLIFPGGRNYTYGAVIEMLENVGFKNVEKNGMSFFNVNSIVTGTK